MASNNYFCRHTIQRSLAMLLASFSLLAQAGAQEDIATIQSTLESRTPPIKARSVKPSPIAGLYEVFVQGNLIYTDKTFSYVIVNGAMMDTSSKKNLTEESLNQLTTIKFSELPLQNAIEIKKGSGAYQFAVFSDPDCPYCKSLESGLAKAGVSDYTAYIFLYPLKTLHPDAAAKSESIWCAKDKAEAWTNFMVKGTAPEKANCDNPLAANEKLADKIGVSGTPSIYLKNGHQTQNPQELVAAIKANQ
ncbi:MAG: DsbC family protein [Burkholderiaceae bacterium]|nr:DsbC family protein [Burkholderiaceae bacterium]